MYTLCGARWRRRRVKPLGANIGQFYTVESRKQFAQLRSSRVTCIVCRRYHLYVIIRRVLQFNIMPFLSVHFTPDVTYSVFRLGVVHIMIFRVVLDCTVHRYGTVKGVLIFLFKCYIIFIAAKYGFTDFSRG